MNVDGSHMCSMISLIATGSPTPLLGKVYIQKMVGIQAGVHITALYGTAYQVSPHIHAKSHCRSAGRFGNMRPIAVTFPQDEVHREIHSRKY